MLPNLLPLVLDNCYVTSFKGTWERWKTTPSIGSQTTQALVLGELGTYARLFLSRHWLIFHGRGEQVETLATPLIPQSRYLEQLETGQDESEANQEEENQSKEAEQLNPNAVRYWSDFSHVRFAPESIQALAFNSESNSANSVNWDEGRSNFKRYDADADVMDGPLRQLVEECDSLQVCARNHTNTTSYDSGISRY